MQHEWKSFTCFMQLSIATLCVIFLFSIFSFTLFAPLTQIILVFYTNIAANSNMCCIRSILPHLCVFFFDCGHHFTVACECNKKLLERKIEIPHTIVDKSVECLVTLELVDSH